MSHVVGPLNSVSLHGLSFLGVTDILTPPSDPPPSSPGLSLAYRGPDATIYANHRALPHAFVVSGRRMVAGDDAALVAVANPMFDARRTLIEEGPGSSSPSAGQARIVSYAPDRVVISASASRPATVVLSDVWFPGWKAEVDGSPIKVARVDHLFRDVRLRPGVHRVVFSYEPDSWKAARLVTGLAVLALLGAVGVAPWRRRRIPMGAGAP